MMYDDFISIQVSINCFSRNEIYYTNVLLLLLLANRVVIFIARKRLINTSMEIRLHDTLPPSPLPNPQVMAVEPLDRTSNEPPLCPYGLRTVGSHLAKFGVGDHIFTF